MSATQHANLAEALAAFQGEDGLTFPKTKTARVQTRTGGEYTYKYADLGDILPVLRPLLSKHGLSWRAKPILTESGDMHLWYRLEHVSGETDTGQIPLGVKTDCKPQELGSAITYARRYAMTAQLNLATDEDDDGKAAQEQERGRTAVNGNGNGHQPTAAAPRESPRHLNEAQREMLETRSRAKGLSAIAFANVIKVAKGEEPSEVRDEEVAGRYLKRELDRLPASLVTAVKEGIDAV